MHDHDTPGIITQLEDEVTQLREELHQLKTGQLQISGKEEKTLPSTHRRQWLKKLTIAVAGFVGASATMSIPSVLAGNNSTANQPALPIQQSPSEAFFVKFKGVDAKQYRRKGRDLEGTVFPSNPDSGDRYFRTDRCIEYYWDGTNWLSLSPFYYAMTYNPNAFSRPLTNNFAYYQIVSNPETTYSIYIESLTLISSVTQVFDANNYWLFQMLRFFDDNVGVPLVSKSIYQADRLVDRHYVDVIPVNTIYSKDNFKTFALNWTKMGNPGGLSDHPVTIRYRLVG